MTGISILIRNFRKNLLLLFAIPILLLCFIYITYGEIFDYYLITKENKNYLSLTNHLNIFLTDIKLPKIVKEIGFYSVISIFVIYICWLISNLFGHYLSLKQGDFSKLIIFLEIFLLVSFTILFILPGLDLIISILIYISILFLLIMVTLYLIYYKKKNSNEEK